MMRMRAMGLALALALPALAQAAEAPDDAATARALNGRLLQRPRTLVEAELGSPAGKPHHLSASVPGGPAPPGGFPVIYVLDGDGWCGAAVEIAKVREYGKLDPAVIVCVGYPSRHFFDAAGRTYDFTPPGASDPDFEGLEQGGAGDFLAFLDGTVKPWADRQARIDPGRRALFGHSMGGLFVLYALFKAPGGFQTYIAASPSIWFAGKAVLKGERAFEADPARKAVRVLITNGGLEGAPSPELMDDYRRFYTAHPELIGGRDVEAAVKDLFAGPRVDMLGDARGLAGRLAKSGVSTTYAVFEGEEHTASAIDALNRGVPFALRPG